MNAIVLQPGAMSLQQLEDVYWRKADVAVDPACRAAVEKAAAVISDAAVGDDPVYGVNTGFGKLASVKIAPRHTATLQRNLILSHC